MTKITPAIALLALSILFGIITSYILINPPATPPDELSHLAYPRQLFLTGQLPTYETPEDYWESHQPPAFYLLSLPFIEQARSLPFASQIIVARLLSGLLVLGSAMLMIGFIMKRFSDKPITMLTGLLLFFLPMVMYTGGSFSNDSLVLFIATLLITQFPKKDSGAKAYILYGLWLGIALLTKAHIYPLVAVLSIYILFTRPIKKIFISGATALLVSAWWFIHNIVQVGDVFGLRNTFILWTDQHKNIDTLSGVIELFSRLVSSFIGVFGKLHIYLPQMLYVIVAILLVSLLLWGTMRIIKNKKHLTILALIGILTTIAFVVIQNFSFYQPQGRYLIACIPLLAIVLIEAASMLSNKKISLAFFSLLLLFFIGLNGISLKAIHTEYQKHPVQFMQTQRTIDLTAVNWNGDTQNIQKKQVGLLLQGPVRIFTLSDLRLFSDHQPKITLQTETKEKNTMQVRWKILGQNRFSDDRKVTFTLEPDTTVRLLEPDPTLIQDIEISLLEHTSVTLTALTISTE